MQSLPTVLKAYGLSNAQAFELGKGLINQTWKINSPQGQYVLQKINDEIFKKPEDISDNIRLVSNYLKKNYPEYFFVTPVQTKNGEDLVKQDGGGYYRLFPFVEGSHTIDIVSTPQQAYEAAAQFGKFTKLLSAFDSSRLKITLPHFHDLHLRYHQFLISVKKGNPERIAASQKQIQQLLSRQELVQQYQNIISGTEFKKRVTHHDTKISNVLFDKNEKAICVIDLDTLMPGYFISDVGDMMRTYLSPAGEEEKDLEKIEVRNDFYMAIVHGYSGLMGDELTSTEKKYFFYAGQFMIYMQAMRFLTDHLNNDVYYGARYKGHNYMRAVNQITLLDRLEKKEGELKRII